MLILIVSNVAQDGLIEKGMSMGAAAYVIKSTFTPDKVVSEVKSLLS
jgi:DNA-binding NarL/FixJ family response regulator